MSSNNSGSIINDRIEKKGICLFSVINILYHIMHGGKVVERRRDPKEDPTVEEGGKDRSWQQQQQQQ